MKKVILLTLVSLSLLSCSNSHKATKYLEQVVSKIDKKEQISFSVDEIMPLLSQKYVYYANRKDSVWGFNQVDFSKTIFYPDSIKYISLSMDKLSLIIKKENMNAEDSFAFYNTLYFSFFGQAEYVNLYLFPKSGLNQIKYYKNLKINNDKEDSKYKIISFENRTLSSYDKEGNLYPIPYMVKLYVNDSSKIIEKIESKRIECKYPEDTINNVTYYISDISFDDKKGLIDSVFDFNNKEYTNFNRLYQTFFDESDEIDTTAPIHKLDSFMVMTNEMLNAPIINLNGDTTTIGEEKGWILVDFWFIGCKPCLETFVKMKDERQKYGQTLLEKEGIKIMMINPYSENINHITRFCAQYSMDKDIYLSKAIEKYFDLYSLPQYFLISPDKKIYRIKELNDYSEILKIKGNQ
ncbi:MAG: hypothetical protein LBL74_04915 [Bacteroidales bacterium]|nr:hypothetical protein [Bacteroidales bacterium]